MKPAVDRLEHELGDSAILVRLDVQSDLGATLKEEYEIPLIPTFLIFDLMGNEFIRMHKVPEYEEIREMFP